MLDARPLAGSCSLAPNPSFGNAAAAAAIEQFEAKEAPFC